jgi:hypothetical protein
VRPRQFKGFAQAAQDMQADAGAPRPPPLSSPAQRAAAAPARSQQRFRPCAGFIQEEAERMLRDHKAVRGALGESKVRLGAPTTVSEQRINDAR